MKKQSILLMFLLSLLLLCGCGAEKTPETTGPTDVETFLAEHWPQFEAEYRQEDQHLSLRCATQMSYDDACRMGKNVYSGTLAPETYLDDVTTVALDVIAHCSCEALTVELSYVSTEGTPIFTVCTDGTVETCWEE